MIPTELQEGLKGRLEQAFTGRLFKSPESDQAPLSFYKQHLPVPVNDEEESSFFPYVIIQLQDGEQLDEESEQTVKVMFIIGAYDHDRDNQGYQFVTSIIQKITESLKKNPLINQKFELKYPLKWAVHDEDLSPYYFGGVETSWGVPAYTREDVEALI